MSFVKNPFFWALTLRLILAWTRFGWNHPDEWFQTVEFGNVMASGLGSFTQENLLHMRNLSLPTLWAAVIAGVRLFTEVTGATWDWSRSGLSVGWIQTLSAFADTAACYAWYRLFSRKTASSLLRNYFAFTLALAVPLLQESFRPSAEHWAAILVPFLLLGLEGTGFWAGFLVAALGAMKLSVLPFALGAGVTSLIKRPSQGRRAGIGFAIGLAIFGLSDYLYYGEFWQSARMYTQFNLVAGLAQKNFGAQSALIYLEYWRGQWPGVFLVFGLLSLPLVFFGMARSLKNREAWVSGVLFFLIAHVIIGHKEPRFMGPLLAVYFFAIFMGLNQLSPRILKSRGLGYGVAIFLILQTGWGLTVFGRDYFRASGVFFAVTSNLKSESAQGNWVCGVITVRKPLSILMQDVWWQKDGRMRVPLAFFPMGRREGLQAGKSLIWMEEKPTQECISDSKGRYLIQLHRVEVLEELETKTGVSCDLMSNRWLRVLPAGAALEVRKRGLLGSVWASCKASDLTPLFKKLKVETRYPFVRGFGSWRNPPSLSMDQATFEAWSAEQLAIEERATGHKINDGTLGDYD